MSERIRFKKKLVFALGVGALALASTIVSARPNSDGGGFVSQECKDPKGPAFWECQGHHPQVAEAISAFYRNGVYNIVDIKPASPKSVIAQFRTLTAAYTFPAYQKPGNARSVEITGPGTGLGFPTGTFAIDMPEGRIPMIVKTVGEKFPGAPKVTTTWAYLHLGPNEKATLRGVLSGWSSTTTGPLAFELEYENPGGQENPIVLAQLVQPGDQTKIR